MSPWTLLSIAPAMGLSVPPHSIAAVDFPNPVDLALAHPPPLGLAWSETLTWPSTCQDTSQLERGLKSQAPN